MGRVVVGMDPHKRSANDRGDGRRGDRPRRRPVRRAEAAGYAAMKKYAARWPDRIWAIEGCNGIGGHIARRLLADGEQVIDVPPKLSARARVFSTGQGRKTDAHCVALVATRMMGLSAPHGARGSGLSRRCQPSSPRVLARAARPPADSWSRSIARAVWIRRMRVSGFFAPSIASTCSRLRP